MDIPLQKTKRRFPVVIAIITCGIALLALFFYLYTNNNATHISRADLAFATVQKSEMKFSITGVGILVPRVQKLQTAGSAAMVEEIFIQAGSPVKAGQVLIRLSAPLLRQQLAAAKAEVQKSEADLKEGLLNVQLEDVVLKESAELLTSQLTLETKELAAKRELLGLGVVAKLNFSRQEALVSNLQAQIVSQREKANVVREINRGKIEVKRDHVARRKAALALVQQEEQALQVRCSINGAVQDIFVTLGQAVAAGERLVQVADTADLIATINVPQNKASALRVGSPATLRVEGRTIRGKVIRIDPKVRDGAVPVDIAPEEALPPGVRSAQTVTGDIVGSSAVPSLFIEKSADLLPYEQRELFIETDKNQLMRRTVQFGPASGNFIEVISGLAAGERIALKIKPSLYQHPVLHMRQ
jgi:HlyD family secretion protein